jgi:ferredoxin
VDFNKSGFMPGRSGEGKGITLGRRANRPGLQKRTVAYVVTEPCFGCKYTDCVVVCPCDCFREGEQMLFIDPDECIDCDACKAECPVEAIVHEDDVPEAWKEFVALNGSRPQPVRRSPTGKSPSPSEERSPDSRAKTSPGW